MMIMCLLFLIGCKNCANVAPDIFKIEEDFGRARACNQRGNPDLLQQAVETWLASCVLLHAASDCGETD